MTCPSCGSENPAGQRFCGECGALLAAPVRATTEERKVVTALFCDLVGFTATSEAADPEDVDRMLSAYAAMAKGHIERHGGVVEKFIGDAVVGIFGVPAAHEDDPERAVRAALRIAEDAEELEGVGGAALRLRVGINTGETLVRLGVAPGSGERMLAGDAINTASRIQSIAPEMGVAVGLGTYEATERRLRLRRARACRAQGEGRRGPGVLGQEPARQARDRPHPFPRHPVHRARDRSRAARRHLREGRGRERSAARDRGGRARARQVQDRGGAGRVRRCQARPDRVASGSVPPVR